MPLVWAARVWLVVGNAIALSFTMSTAFLYEYFLTDSAIQIGLSQLGANTHEFFLPVIVSSIVVSVIHLFVVVGSLIPTRRLFGCGMAIIWRPRKARVQPVSIPVVPGYPQVVRDKLTATKTLVSYTWSRYSTEITRLFMLWEVSLQTFQACKMSYLVASVSINRLIALVIVINCWFSPILHYVMGNRPMARIRLGRLMLDSGLDVIYNIVIPLSIFYPYYRDFCDSVSLYPVVYYYDDIWYANAVSELRQVLVTSWPDYISKCSGWLSLVHRLWKVKTAAEDATRAARGRRLRRSVSPVIRATKLVRSRLSHFLDLMLVLWGITILSLHLTSSITSLWYNDSGCLLQMRPWGSLAYSCASFEISCSKHRIQGDQDAMEAVLTTIDPLSVQNLILSNCPELHVPSTVQKLRYLMMIKVYNSTIVAWDKEAALSQAYHPQLQVVYFARVNVTNFPEGLLTTDFPSSVWDIEFCITNITTFPPAIATAWRHVGIVAHEGNSELTEFPAVLTTLPSVFTLNLGMNNIKTVGDGDLKTLALVGIGMNGNPVDELPDRIGNIEQLSYLSFMGTKITEVPTSWMAIPVPTSKPSGSTLLYAAGSPLCDLNKVQTVAKPTWLGIDCEVPPDGLFSYPIHEEDIWRRINQ